MKPIFSFTISFLLFFLIIALHFNPDHDVVRRGRGGRRGGRKGSSSLVTELPYEYYTYQKKEKTSNKTSELLLKGKDIKKKLITKKEDEIMLFDLKTLKISHILYEQVFYVRYPVDVTGVRG